VDLEGSGGIRKVPECSRIWKVLESLTGSVVPTGREDSRTILEVLENLKLSE